MKKKQKEWIGFEIRNLRESLKLTRKEFAQYLNVSAVTIEKWELSPKEKIRPKYYQALGMLSGGGVAATAIGLAAAPALVGPAMLLGGIGLSMDLMTDSGIKSAIEKLEALRKLNPEERETLIRLWEKMNTP